MARVRLVTTPMWSEEHLLAALAQVGFPDVEKNRAPVPLDSWRGTPIGATATLVLRRRHIGAASDDVGFVRNDRGSFEMVLSEGNFFRFDRRWIEDVARRHDELAAAAGRTAPPNLPGWEKRYLVSGPTGAPSAAEPAREARLRPEAAAPEHHATRARAEAATALDELRKQQKRADGPGCIVGFVAPMILWGLLATNESGFQNPAGFFLVVGPLWVAFAIYRGVRMARRTKRAAQALVDRLPSGTTAKDAALDFLRTKVKPAGGKSEDVLVKELLKALRKPHE